MALRPLEPPPYREQIQVQQTLGGWGFSRAWETWFNLLGALQRKTVVLSVTLDPAAVSANTTADQTFDAPGLTTDMAVFVSKPTCTAGLGIVNARCSAVDVLAITFANVTGAPINAGEETYLVYGARQ